MKRNVLLGFLCFAVLLQAGLADERLDARRDAVVVAIEKSAPAVVNISTEKVVHRGLFSNDSGPFNDPLFDRFMEQFSRPEISTSLGSGGIFTPDGYIFTNAHVVNRASRIMVTLSDGSQYPAELLNVDLATDLAVIKIAAPDPLPTLTLGRSDDLMPGEKAIAVGNPFGLSNTVTTGAISATHRDVVIDGRTVFKDFLQTDALINPGNSGGPLLNIFGEVIGVNSAMRADAQGIGFAIPVDRAKHSLGALMDYRKHRRLRLGFDLEERFTGTGPESELVVQGVAPSGPAAAAGFAVGDVVKTVGGRRVTTLVDFMAAVLSLAEESVEMTVSRDGGEVALDVVPLIIPKPDGAKLAQAMFGLSVQQMNRELAGHVGIDIDKGVLVAEVAEGSTAALSGIQSGDVILQVNDSLTADMETFAAALESAGEKPAVYLVVLRRQGRRYYQFSVEVPLAGRENI